jgi:hypothetical protein
LQFGYFRACQRFFAGHFHSADRQYISAKFNLSSGNEEILSYSRPTLQAAVKNIVGTLDIANLIC